ncbi:DNA-binding protein, partial [Salmonella enterica subsp. diarizonae]|nr:DNA-binding protein [Salmonella enterica subsp. diarizonae]EDT0211882.1 DNA-binding protein [Salmonella enterica subsp. diarizonae]EIZ0118710.1 DNA-binding protein [Salmonella enterica]ELX5565506.1 DNA-binding protein [Salmonella enterica]
GKGTGRLGSEMKALAKHCGGSHKTVNDRLYM